MATATPFEDMVYTEFASEEKNALTDSQVDWFKDALAIRYLPTYSDPASDLTFAIAWSRGISLPDVEWLYESVSEVASQYAPEV